MDENKVWATVLAEDNNSEHLVLPSGYPLNYRPHSMLLNMKVNYPQLLFYPQR
jgi:hypothetical protein